MMGKRLVMLVATMALVVASCGGGVVETAAESDALGTEIGVHGAWTITVLEPDGSLASTTDFTNTLTEDGGELLMALLVGAWTIGSWGIDLTNPLAEETLCGDDTCRVVEPQSTIGDADSTNLTSSGEFRNISLGTPPRVILSGSVEATDDGEIRRVATFNHICSSGFPESTSPEQCLVEGGDFLVDFTVKFLHPVPVAAGQTVQVEVEITFGTLTTP